jgi:hypothetical protein
MYKLLIKITKIMSYSLIIEWMDVCVESNFKFIIIKLNDIFVHTDSIIK